VQLVIIPPDVIMCALDQMKATGMKNQPVTQKQRNAIMHLHTRTQF